MDDSGPAPTGDVVVSTMAPEVDRSTARRLFRVRTRLPTDPHLEIVVDRNRIPDADDYVLMFNGHQYARVSYQSFLHVTSIPFGWLLLGVICQYGVDLYV